MKAKGIGVKGSGTWDEDHSCPKVQGREVTHMFAFWRGWVCVCVWKNILGLINKYHSGHGNFNISVSNNYFILKIPC
jgi:hypothetical protein